VGTIETQLNKRRFKMKIQILLTSKDVEHLKQKARKLKQEEGITHTQALDKIAQRAKFNHWHHVCESYKRIEPTETAYRSGVIIAMDIKDADDFYDEENLFVEDEYAFWICQEDMYRQYGEMQDDDGIPIKNLESEDELRQGFEEDMMNYSFFRLTGKKIPDALEEVLSLVRERSFWPPMYVWLNGQFHNTFSQSATSETGEILGIRF
jgi:hypothetical protein